MKEHKIEKENPLISYISKTNNVAIGNAEDLDIAMPMYNITEWSKIYRKTTKSLWSYTEDKPGDCITNLESFKSKTNILAKRPYDNNDDDDNTKDVKIVAPLKYLSNFWRNLGMLLINSEVNMILTWRKDRVLIDMTITDAKRNYPAVNRPTNVSSSIKDTKFYITVVT